MNLPFLKKKEEEKDFFLVLLLSSGKVGSILFEKTGGKLLIVGSHDETLTDPLDALEPNKLIELADIVISEVEQRLPEGAHLEKTIFAVPQRWVEDGKIKKDHLAGLKRVCEALELTPVGFVVSIEALTSYLHQTEGAPVTAIFVEVGEKLVTVSIVKNGNILSVAEKEIEEDAVKTTELLLHAQEAVEVLPSKIILLNFDNAKKVQQKFLSHTWSKSLAFLHLPQVTVLPVEVESQAVISGVASQMGFDNVEDPSHAASASVVPPPLSDKKEEESVEDEEKEDQEDVDKPDASTTFAGEDMGFYREKDVLKDEPESSPSDNFTPVIHDHKKAGSEPVDEENAQFAETAVPEEPVQSKGMSFPKISLPLSIPKIGNILPSGNKFYLYPVAGVIALFALGFLYYFMFEKATVTLYLDKNVVTKDMPITFAINEASSVEDGILQIETREITIEGEESKKATGEKETGEKAKGEITLYNKTEGRKTFEKGTGIVGPNNLVFTLTDDVQVASTSSFSTSFSSAKGKVEASKFGKEYNIPSGTNFSIENESTANYFAKNDQAFSGGSSKKVTVVSEEDLSALDSALIEKLRDEAVQKATSEKDAEEDILGDPMDYAFDSKDYSKKEGDEASDVTLTGSITFSFGVYKKSDLFAFAKEASSSEVDSDSVFSEKDSSVEVRDIKSEDDETQATFVFSSVFLPKLETTDLASKVAGKNSDKTYEILDLPGVEDVKVEFTRSIPFLPKLLPFNKSNITVVVEAKE